MIGKAMLERSHDPKASTGMLYGSSAASSKPLSAAHLDFNKTKVVYNQPSILRNQASSGLSDINPISKIKVQNLHRVNKRSFERMGDRATVAQIGIGRGGSQKVKLYKT